MRVFGSLRSVAWTIFHRSRIDDDMDAELRAHIEDRANDLERPGLPHAEAERRARLEFGGYQKFKEECREAAGTSLLDALSQDASYGLRTLRKSPGFALVAVLTLALGIGASTAVFSVVNGILLKPLPYPNAERIAIPWLLSPPGVNIGSDYFPWGEVQFSLLTHSTHPFRDVGAFVNDSFNLTGSGEPVRLDGFRASAGFFPTLGVSPVLGRTYSPEEDKPGREHVVVLSHRLWTERFGSDRNILGRAIELNGLPYTIIGVMPSGFAFPRSEEMPVSFNFPREPELWVPYAMPDTPRRGPSELAVIGRLKQSVTLTQAQAQMDVVTKQAEAADPRWKGWFNTRVTPLEKQVVGDTQRPLLLILCSVGVVLLIACSNVANLLLARSFGRTKEFTLRAALGAGRGRLVRQLLTESMLLSVIAGLFGIALAEPGVYFVKSFGPADTPRLQEVTLDVHVFFFAFAISILTGILFGLAPAIGADRENIFDSLKEGGQRSGGSPTHPRLRSALLISEVALALVLLVSAGLLVRTFYRLLGVDPGFRADRVVTFELTLPSLKYPDQSHIVALYTRILHSLRSVPSVQSVGIAETLPMGGEGESTVIKFPDQPAVTDKELPFANYTIISPGYFSAVGASLLRGRSIAETDTIDSLPVTVINAAMAKKYWPGQDPLGKRVALGSPRYPTFTVVGIVADMKHVSMSEDTVPEMYVPYTQKQWPSMLTMRVALRTKSDPAAMSRSLQEAIHSVDADLPIAKRAPLTTLLDASMTKPRFTMLVLASFAGLALLLATIGMYGVISYAVSQRTREIGIRMALGARRANVFAMVLGQGARLAAAGIAIGLVFSLAVTRLMVTFLYDVQPTDPLTFASVSFLLVGIALFACYVPARRAMSVDPNIALRYE
jgi:predicted permease